MTERDAHTQLQERAQVTRPPPYKVLLLNDDYTPMDFVVDVLTRYFRKSGPEAERVMLAVHQRGRGVAGVYTRDVAETKMAQVTAAARAAGHPLQVTIEPGEEG